MKSKEDCLIEFLGEINMFNIKKDYPVDYNGILLAMQEYANQELASLKEYIAIEELGRKQMEKELAEKEKEIERLKGLIEKAFDIAWSKSAKVRHPDPGQPWTRAWDNRAGGG